MNILILQMVATLVVDCIIGECGYHSIYILKSEALFDICVIDTDAQFYCDCTHLTAGSLQGMIKRGTSRLVKMGGQLIHLCVCLLMA